MEMEEPDFLTVLLNSEYFTYFVLVLFGVVIGYALRYSQSRWKKRTKALKRAQLKSRER